MNAESPTPPSGPSDPTSPQDPTLPQDPTDFTEHGPSIFDDEDDGETKEPTPEEKAEHELFDRCRGLLTVLIKETPINSAIDSESSKDYLERDHGALYGTEIPGNIDDPTNRNYREHKHQVQFNKNDDQPDRPHSMYYGFNITNNPKYDRLFAGILNYDLTVNTPNQPNNVSVDISARGRHDLPNPTSIHFTLLESGKLNIYDLFIPNRLDGITDHIERMSRLNELYEILTKIYADLPYDNSAPTPNPSTPPDNLVQ